MEGTPERPRLCVFRSNKHLYVQVIDDTKMHTLAAASTMQKAISEEISYSSGPTVVSVVNNYWSFLLNSINRLRSFEFNFENACLDCLSATFDLKNLESRLTIIEYIFVEGVMISLFWLGLRLEIPYRQWQGKINFSLS